ncbi:MAG: prolyl oligopeptidase family serine peptidase [Propionibacteriaceae bacterium]|jgi:dipeptidyl aminopeptidase/acylaminoacyl peptidase|nr:prolyl oligopeptidase family serine peptidase [Propionibacteriaceae bacterium]
MVIETPYGAWPSPFSVDMVAGGAVSLPGGWCDGGDFYWLRGDPNQKGRVSLWRRRGGVEADLTPACNVRSSIHEYGGGAAAVGPGLAVYTDYATGHVFCLEGEGPARLVAAGGQRRYGGFALVPGRRQVVCVREDHAAGGAQTVDAVVVLDLDSANPGGGRVLAEGADFYYAPQVSADGRVAWTEWDHPNMPWDATRLRLRPLDGGPTATVADDGASAVHPSWAPDGSLVFLTDASGYWNFARWSGDGPAAALHDDPYDFCGPAWVLEPPPYALLPDGSVGCSWLVDGRARLGWLRPGGALEELRLDAALADVSLSPGYPRSVAHLAFSDRPGGLWTVDWTTGAAVEAVRAADLDLDPGYVARPQEFTWDGPDGPVHAWFYPPTHPGRAAPAGERPPVLVTSHGGPTAFSAPDFSLKRLFWTSRGVGVLDVNYGGSTGYGRAYRERLKGRWGIVDVRDCADAAANLAAAGLADPARLAIMGGSAGGYTTLAALCFTDQFAAGISLYGIGDLEALAKDTHKFESRYLDGLVAPYPAGRQTYLDRSPIWHLDGLSCPMLILQGEDDLVVPKEQAIAMAAAVEAKGLMATLVVYPGEGHGFRQAATLRDQYERMERFLGQVFGYEPAAV